MTLQEAKMFIRNANNFIEMFGEELFEKAVANYSIKDFSTFEYVIYNGGQDNYYAKKGYPVLCDRTSHTFKEYKGEWMREVLHLARKYRIPCHYQLHEKDLLRDCILLVNPNMANYQMSIYHLDGAKEIYIKCDNGKSLYVPVKAIVDKDYSLVEQRMNTYWSSYYNTPNRKQYLDAELATLKTKTAKALKKTIEEDESYVCEKAIKELPIGPRTVTVSFDITLPGTIEEVEEEVKNNLKFSLFTTYTNIKIKEV